jgi:hypothetical protein
VKVVERAMHEIMPRLIPHLKKRKGQKIFQMYGQDDALIL